MWAAERRAPIGRFAVASVLLAILVTLALNSVASADQAFHTQQIALTPLHGAPLQSGFVIDIHVNGPQIYALERYQLNGAAPNTTYQVQLLIFTNATCSGTPITVPSSSLRTNSSGNGEASIEFAPQQVPAALRHTVISIIWQVLNAQTVSYQTACTVVVQD